MSASHHAVREVADKGFDLGYPTTQRSNKTATTVKWFSSAFPGMSKLDGILDIVVCGILDIVRPVQVKFGKLILDRLPKPNWTDLFVIETGMV